MKENYTREDLISICEKAIVEVSKWSNRDSPSSQKSVGELWALLKGGCDFEICNKGNLITDDRTIWVRVYFPNFSQFDYIGFDLNDKSTLDNEIFYLPTINRLEIYNGEDWY